MCSEPSELWGSRGAPPGASIITSDGEPEAGRAGIDLSSPSDQGQPCLLGKLVSPSVPQFPWL